MITVTEMPQRAFRRTEIHQWCFRVFFFLSAIMLCLLGMVIWNAAMTSADQQSTEYLVVPCLYTFLAFVLPTLALTNFDRALFQMGQLFLLAVSIVIFCGFVLLMGVVISKGIGRTLNWHVDYWYGEVVGVLLILGGVLWYRKRKRRTRHLEENHQSNITAPRPVIQDQSPRRLALLLRRTCACLLDYGVFGMIVFFLNFVLGERIVPPSPGNFLETHPASLSAQLSLWAWVFYFVGIEALWGRSPGQFVFGLAVHREYPTDRRIKVSVLRHMLDPVEVIPLGVIALLVALIRRDGKRLGDIIAGCRVVNTW